MRLPARGADPFVLDGHNDLPWALRELAGPAGSGSAAAADPGGADPGGVDPGGVDPGGADPGGVDPGGADPGAPLQGGVDVSEVDLAGGMPQLQTDLPRLRRGGVGAQFWSVYVPTSLRGDEAVRATLEQIDLVHRLVAAHPRDLELATTADQVRSAVAAGRIASLLGAEGGHCINGSLAVLRILHALGVRYLTLTHNESLAWADSATDAARAGGLSDFGEQVVAQLQDLGMLVDLSHVSDTVMHDVLDIATAPVMFSHSSARAICDTPRNVPDEVLARLAGNGGVCMVAFPSLFVRQEIADWYRAALAVAAERGADPRDFAAVRPVFAERMRVDPPPTCTAEDVADHVEHVREVAGAEHVGLGGDYDGADAFPQDMPDVAGYPRLFEVLRGRGWSESEIAALAHGNVLRVMSEAEHRAAAPRGAPRSSAPRSTARPRRTKITARPRRPRLTRASGAD